MATIALSAAGMALGGSIGGSVLGLSMATIGRAAGAAVGRRIDAQILGSGSEPVEIGRLDRFRLTGATEGADIPRLYGRMRVAGQVIWASQFLESSTTSGGSGKGSSPSTPTTTTYSYTVSLAIALCEGEIGRIGRVWADGAEISPDALNMRVYPGTDDQMPDPKIAAVEGASYAPAYRGTAYVVLEDLALGQFGNRIPQLTFEVIRAPRQERAGLSQAVRAVSLQDGTGEYTFATSRVHLNEGYGAEVPVNTNTPLGPADIDVSLDALQGDLPQCRSVMVPVAWFGDDLRCDSCAIAPMVTHHDADADAFPWRVSGMSRVQAMAVPSEGDTQLYEGTPADAAFVEALVSLQGRGISAVACPKLLMVQTDGNVLTDPWTSEAGQPRKPWRGLITASVAPGWPGSPDGTATATAQVAAFMGNAAVGDFAVSGTTVSYTGATDSGYRRFILHYAHLCAAAGGVDGFCIGSQLAGLTQLRDGAGGYPMVDALQVLAADVRAILGSSCKISYAADWTEYHGFTPAGTDDKLFYLDALWADPNIDFVGIDFGAPLADWRTGRDHADAHVGSIYDRDYLRNNVAGGEQFDWTYTTPEARAAQRRTVLSDPDGEDWVWRAKDLAGWWGNAHHDRSGGERSTTASPWVPGSKPIWLTGVGCPAVHVGANAPDAATKAANALPYGSDGSRDDVIQQAYVAAVLDHYAAAENNPASTVYDGQMIDLDRLYVSGWDARPFPFWPGNQARWADGATYPTGLALNGRGSNCALADVVSEICTDAGIADVDTTALHGVVRGFRVADAGTGRAALQPLMLAYGFDAIERDGTLVFQNRQGQATQAIDDAKLARDPDDGQALSVTRAPAAEIAGRVQLAHLHADGEYSAIAAEVVLPDETGFTLTRDELPLVMTRAEGVATVSRWLQEARMARETARFGLPPSASDIAVGDVVTLDTQGHAGTYRVDRIEDAGVLMAEATRVGVESYQSAPVEDASESIRPYIGPSPAEVLFMDLPLLTGDEAPHAPYVASSGRPWTGSIALYSSPQDSGYSLLTTLDRAATIGVTEDALDAGPIGTLDRQSGMTVTLVSGGLSSASMDALLAGENLIAIGDGSGGNWEILQFQNATAQAERTYVLSGLLRGQFGTRGQMPAAWPAGSHVVLLDGTPQSLALPSATRGTARHFRHGPVSLPMNDPTYRYSVHSFDGNGLRPYPVAHLRVVQTGADLAVSWIRSTRIDGDIWGDVDVPLGEASEAYFLRVLQGGVTVRDIALSTASWIYAAAEQAIDLDPGPYRIEVAQLSERYGAGPFMGVDMP